LCTRRCSQLPESTTNCTTKTWVVIVRACLILILIGTEFLVATDMRTHHFLASTKDHRTLRNYNHSLLSANKEKRKRTCRQEICAFQLAAGNPLTEARNTLIRKTKRDTRHLDTGNNDKNVVDVRSNEYSVVPIPHQRQNTKTVSI